MKKVSFLIVLGAFLGRIGLAAPQELPILEKESAKSALALYMLLDGPDVLTQFGVRQLLLDETQNTVLTCHSQEQRCTVSNPGFEQSFSSDYDLLLTLSGAAAKKLYRNLPELRNATGEYHHSLGYSGKYGSDVVSCSITKAGQECQIYRSYCYQPGC